MNLVGDVAQCPHVDAVYQAVFESKREDSARVFRIPTGEMLRTILLRYKNLYACYYQGWCYVEQNPNTGSAPARRAQQGAQILWVIRVRDDFWGGCVEDGQFSLAPALDQLRKQKDKEE